MMGATAGYTWRKPRTKDGDLAPLDADEHVEKARRAEKALRSAVKQGINDPESVYKSLNPSFRDEYALFLTGGRSDPIITSLQAQVAELAQKVGVDAGKNFTTGSPLSTGLVPFDLEAPSHLIYWFDCPLYAKIPREPGRGTSHRTKVVTGVSGSQTGGSAGNIVDISTSEITSFSTWPGTLPSAGSQNAVDVNISYKFMGLSESLSWLAQFAGVGFEDIASLANLILMQEFRFGEEYLNIAGTSTALSAPTIALTARTAGTGETAVSGYTTDAWVRVSTKNYYGETASSTVQSAAVTNGTSVVDVVITPPAGQAGQQYNVYVGTGAADPGAAGCHFQASLGGTKFTIQGALPTTGATAPTADSGTSGANRWEGMLSVLSGHTAGANGYPAGWQGGYVNSNVQNTLNLSVIHTALQQVYDGSGAFRASPEELLCEGLDAKNLSEDVAKNQSGTNYQLKIDQNEMAGVIHGTAVSQVVNPVTRKLMNITVHPGWLQGTAVLTQWTTPNAARNGNVWEMRMVQDLLSVSWPVIDPTYRFSIFEFGTFFGQAPQYAALLGGLQASASNPWS